VVFTGRRGADAALLQRGCDASWILGENLPVERNCDGARRQAAVYPRAMVAAIARHYAQGGLRTLQTVDHQPNCQLSSATN
jgi:hypothetical protein